MRASDVPPSRARAFVAAGTVVGLVSLALGVGGRFDLGARESSIGYYTLPVAAALVLLGVYQRRRSRAAFSVIPIGFASGFAIEGVRSILFPAVRIPDEWNLVLILGWPLLIAVTLVLAVLWGALFRRGL